MKTTIIEKPPYAEVEGDLKIKNSSMPKEVKEFLITNRSRHISIAKIDNDLWVASKLKAKHIQLKNYKEFEVCYMKRAKGGGFVAIQAWPQEKGNGCTSLVDFGIYSDKALQAAIEIASQLEAILGYTLKQDYWGVDC